MSYNQFETNIKYEKLKNQDVENKIKLPHAPQLHQQLKTTGE